MKAGKQLGIVDALDEFCLLWNTAAAMICPLAEAAIPYVLLPDPVGAPEACNHVAPLSDE